MNDVIIANFFDFNTPCPVEIPFCNQMRIKYQEDLSKLSNTGCTSCQRNSLKAKYIKDVWESSLQQMVNKQING